MLGSVAERLIAADCKSVGGVLDRGPPWVRIPPPPHSIPALEPATPCVEQAQSAVLDADKEVTRVLKYPLRKGGHYPPGRILLLEE
jgi:hypothetical protein